MSTVTKALVKDETAQQIKSALDGIISAINADKTHNNAGYHNSIYRGKYLGDSVTESQYEAINNGTFDDLFIGDYWTINAVNYRIAAFDYWLRTGDTECTTHHVVIVPDAALNNAKMNSDNSTAGGYIGCGLKSGTNHDETANTGLSSAESTINTAFGSSHILSHKEYFVNAVTDGHPSGGAWVASTVDLMNECMVYGSEIFEPKGNGTAVYINYTIDKTQLPLFAHDPSKITTRAYWWLRSVVSSAGFAFVDSGGNAHYFNASASFGVRPAFAIKKASA